MTKSLSSQGEAIAGMSPLAFCKGNNQHSGKESIASGSHSIKQLFRVCSLLIRQHIPLTQQAKKLTLNQIPAQWLAKHNLLPMHSFDLTNFNRTHEGHELKASRPYGNVGRVIMHNIK